MGLRKFNEDIKLKKLNKPACTIEEKICQVKGNYNVTAKLSDEEITLHGNWLAEFELDEDFGYWYIINVQIEGINF